MNPQQKPQKWEKKKTLAQKIPRKGHVQYELKREVGKIMWDYSNLLPLCTCLQMI